jgi:hypothetical protein
VTFSIATVLANAPEVAEEIARIREEQRRRFVQGHLFTALRPAVEAHAVLVARITEDGAQPAEHLLVVAPNAVNDYAHRRVHTGLRRGR